MNKVDSFVTMYYNNVASVTKITDNEKKGNDTVLVMLNDREVYIVGMVPRDDSDKIDTAVLLYKRLHSKEDAYRKWVYLVGKMTRKDNSSKYFEGATVDAHFTNGDVDELTEVDKRTIMEFIYCRMKEISNK